MRIIMAQARAKNRILEKQKVLIQFASEFQSTISTAKEIWNIVQTENSF